MSLVPSLSSSQVRVRSPLEERGRQEEEEEGGRRKKRGISGAVEAHINIISLLTCYTMMSVDVCMRVSVACVFVCVTDRQTGRAGEQPEQHMLYISPIIITSSHC